jgi:AcrR family transcriptional regulator
LSEATVAALVAAHSAVLTGGKRPQLRVSGHRSRPRERILDAADNLFSEDGVTGTGVDALIDGADVAKATFYRHFPSKDALIVAWLEDARTRWFDGVRAEAESRATTPKGVIPEFFDAVARWLEAGDYVGCPYLNTALEISDPEHPAMPAIQHRLAEIERWLIDRAGDAGHPAPRRVGLQLHALLAGAIALGVAGRTAIPARAARDAAANLLRP